MMSIVRMRVLFGLLASLVLMSGMINFSTAQDRELQGHVWDAVTGIPVEQALVRVLGSTRASDTENNGFFSIVDIPTGAVMDGRIEVLVTKDGYRPETLIFDLTGGRATISIFPEQTLVEVWFKRLKEHDTACASRQSVVEVISNLALDYPQLKTEAVDILLQISTRYGFPFSVAEAFSAEWCLKRLKDGQRCEGSSEEHSSAIEEESISAGEDGGGPQLSMQLYAVRVMLECARPDEETEDLVGSLLEKLLTVEFIVVRQVDPSSRGNEVGLEVGDVILTYRGESVDSLDEWAQLLSASSGEEAIILEVLKGGSERRVIIVPGGELGIVVGIADPDEVKL